MPPLDLTNISIFGIATGISIFGIATGSTIFMFNWAAKHTLDRLLLPRILDFIASYNKGKALIRAEEVGTALLSEWRDLSDIRLLVIQILHQVLTFLVAVPLVLFALALLFYSLDESHSAGAKFRLLLLIFDIFIIMIAFAITRHYVQLKTYFDYPEALWIRECGQIERLLLKAGLGQPFAERFLAELKEKRVPREIESGATVPLKEPADDLA